MRRPNILVITTDQQRWDALGANGNPDIRTPNLDRLAREGANFTHCFVQNQLCMPSRASFWTGQYPSTLGLTAMGIPVPEDAVTLPRMLRNLGYHCANIGKLHFLPHANRDHRMLHPDYGFDHLEVAEEPGPYEDAYRAWVARKRPDQLDKISAGLPPNAAVWYRTMGIQDRVVHPLPEQERPPGHTVTEGATRFAFSGGIPFLGDDDVSFSAFVAEQTVAYLESRPKGQPFLCVAGFYSPHAPWIVPKRFLDAYDPETLSLPGFPPEVDRRRPAGAEDLFSDPQLRRARHGYYAAVTEVDHHVGLLLDRLEALGLADDTIVVFTSDHGEWLGEHLLFGKSYPAHDCISRVPLIVRMPGGATGVSHDGIVEAIDVLPTLLDAAAIQQPPHLQGRSFFPLLDRRPGYEPRPSALTEFTGWRLLRTPEFRYIAHGDGRDFLFDLRAPWGEYRDVARNVRYRDALARMQHALIQRLIQADMPRTRTWTY
jgi:arylsulfatase A-like enzyme